MAKGDPYQQQHFVASSYLKRWGNPPYHKVKSIWQKEKNCDKIFPGNPNKIFRVEHLYTKFGKNGEKDFSIENWFCNLERNYTKFRPQIECGPQFMSSEAKKSLAYYTAAQMYRTPDVANRFKDKINFYIEIVKGSKNDGSANPSQEWIFFGPLGESVIIKADMLHSILERPFHNFYLHHIRRIAELLLQIHIHLLVSIDPNYTFCTSDNPVCGVVISEDKRKHNLRTNSAMISDYIGLPISPEHKILFNRRFNGRSLADPEIVCDQNLLQVSAATRFIVLAKKELPRLPGSLTSKPPPTNADGR